MSDDIYAMIEKRRLELSTKLAQALEKRDVANSEIKAIRAEIDELPVRKTRRPRKGDDVRATEATIEEIVGTEEGL